MRRTFLIAFLVALLPMACARQKSGSNNAQQTTQTIAPANATAAPTGTDSMTQTVEVEDSRSELEGGSTAPPASGTKAPAAKTKKKGRR